MLITTVNSICRPVRNNMSYWFTQMRGELPYHHHKCGHLYWASYNWPSPPQVWSLILSLLQLTTCSIKAHFPHKRDGFVSQVPLYTSSLLSQCYTCTVKPVMRDLPHGTRESGLIWQVVFHQRLVSLHWSLIAGSKHMFGEQSKAISSLPSLKCPWIGIFFTCLYFWWIYNISHLKELI